MYIYIYIYDCFPIYMWGKPGWHRGFCGSGGCGRGLRAYVGNPGFGIHCHPLDSVNLGFVW